MKICEAENKLSSRSLTKIVKDRKITLFVQFYVAHRSNLQGIMVTIQKSKYLVSLWANFFPYRHSWLIFYSPLFLYVFFPSHYIQHIYFKQKSYFNVLISIFPFFIFSSFWQFYNTLFQHILYCVQRYKAF